MSDSKVSQPQRQATRARHPALAAALLAVIALCVVSPALLAGPQQEQPPAAIANSAAPDPAGVPPAGATTTHTMPTHHPPGDLTGSYTLNTPDRPGFWIAAGFTGVVTLMLIASLVLVRPGREK